MTECVGIIGGIAPESTIDYYRRIHRTYRERTGGRHMAPILINSVDLNVVLSLAGSGRYDALIEYLVPELGKLAAAGATIGVFASNTPHIVFDAIARRSPLPLISIVEATRERAAAAGYQRLALLGTGFVMEADIYPDSFRRSGMAVIVPTAEERAFIHDKYMTEFVPGVFTPETRASLVRILESMKARDRIDAAILGGTELPLILTDPAAAPCALLDTTGCHVDAIVDRMLS